MLYLECSNENISTCSLSFEQKFFSSAFFSDRAITSSIQFIFILMVYTKYHKICLREIKTTRSILLYACSVWCVQSEDKKFQMKCETENAYWIIRHLLIKNLSFDLKNDWNLNEYISIRKRKAKNKLEAIL